MQDISPQDVAMAATATASGQGYPYTLPDFGLPQTSPRLVGVVSVKQEAGRRSPKQMNNQIRNSQVQQVRRMSHVGSPAVSSSQPITNHGAPRTSVPPMPPNRQHPQWPKRVSGAMEESPSYGIRGSSVSYVSYLDLSSMITMPVSAAMVTLLLVRIRSWMTWRMVALFEERYKS
jgi:hypothetical protein